MKRFNIFHFLFINLLFLIIVLGFNVYAQDFTTGTYYYNTNVVTDGLGIPSTYTSNTLSMGSSALTFSNSSRTQAWVLRSDFYSFNMTFVNGHSYKITTVYQIQPYTLGGNYDMRLVGANLRFTNQGNLTANYDGKVTVYNNGNSVDQTVQYSTMNYNGCNGNYCNWTNTFYFTSTTNADSIAMTHGGSNIGQTNRFMFYYPQNPSQYVPEMLTIGTAWVSIDDLGGGTDLDPLIQQQMETNRQLNELNDKTDTINNSLDDIKDKQDETNQIIGDSVGELGDKIDDLKNGQKVCFDESYVINEDTKDNYSSHCFLNTYGNCSPNDDWRTSDYIRTYDNGSITTSSWGNWTVYYCLYDSSKNLDYCSLMPINSTDTFSYDGYIRFSGYIVRSYVNTSATIHVCKNGNQSIFDSINDNNVGGSIENGQDYFGSIPNYSYNGLENILSSPLTLIESMNGTCYPIDITIPYINTSFQIPCLQSYLTSLFRGNTSATNLLYIIKLIVNGLICYKCLSGLFFFFNDLKDPNVNDLEVLDL